MVQYWAKYKVNKMLVEFLTLKKGRQAIFLGGASKIFMSNHN